MKTLTIFFFIIYLNNPLNGQIKDSIYYFESKSNSNINYDDKRNIQLIDKYVTGLYTYDYTNNNFYNINLKICYDTFLVGNFVINNYKDLDSLINYNIESLEIYIANYFDSIYYNYDRDFLIEYKCKHDSLNILSFTKKIIYSHNELNLDLSKINDEYILSIIFEQLNLYRFNNTQTFCFDSKVIIDSNGELYIFFENNSFETILNLKKYLIDVDE